MAPINKLSKTFAGRKIVNLSEVQAIASELFFADGSDPKGKLPAFFKRHKDAAWRVGDLSEEFPELGGPLSDFAYRSEDYPLDALVVAAWTMSHHGDAENVADLFVEHQEGLKQVKHLFLGDIPGGSMRWAPIEHDDYGPLFAALPQLETLRIRGSLGLTFKKAKHATLKSLTIESDWGGLQKAAIQSLLKASFPSLEHLELWFGTTAEGVTAKHLAPILKGDLFPNLTYLGLCNSGITDEIAKVVADAPILEQLETLDLSKGTLTDEGAQYLLDSPLVARLKKVDIAHHYVTTKVLREMKKAKIKIEGAQVKGKKSVGELVVQY